MGLNKKISELTQKNTPVDADMFVLVDTETEPDETKKTTWQYIKSVLKTYFDSIYQAAGSFLTALVDDTSPQLGGDLELNGKNIIAQFEPASNLTSSGIIATMTVDINAQGIGAPLFMAADGHLDTADADTDATSPCVALALETGTGAKKVLLSGVMRVDGWDWDTGPGTAGLIYVSISVGTLQQTTPTGTDEVTQPVGYALSDDVIFFHPSSIYFTHI